MLAGTSSVWFGPVVSGPWDGALGTWGWFWSVVTLLLLLLPALRLPTEGPK